MRKAIVIGLILIFLFSIFSVSGLAEDFDEDIISINYSFEKPKISQTKIDEVTYDKISIDNVPCFGNPGQPFIPMKGSYVLIPQGKGIKSIDVSYKEVFSLGKNFNIEPVPQIVTRSIKTISNTIRKDEKVYSNNQFYPGKLFDKIGSYSFRGYDILILNLYPIQYNPKSGEILYYPELTVSVKTAETFKNKFYRGLEKDKEIAKSKIDNINTMATYDQKTNLNSNTEQYDLLILTTNEFKNSFEPLKNAHDEKGITTEIKTLSDISLIPSSVTAEDIREFVRKEYTENGIEYLLIGGDADIVPTKMLYVSGYDEDNPNRFYDTILPVDQYFGYLDGPFNNDGDELWGEPEDGENGDDVDLFAEVYVGRACVDTVQDVNNFVQKTVSYININVEDDYLKKVTLAGEFLGEYNTLNFGGNLLDALIDGSSRDGFTTVGISSDNYEIETVYDRDWPGFIATDPWNTGWNSQDLLQRANQDIHILTHDGHSNYGYNMKMRNDDVSQFSNTKPFFAYSCGCMAGGFDDPNDYDCFAEIITVKTDNGAFAGLWNARYGFFWADRTDGDGSMFLRQFWDAVYGENIPNIGKANQDSKEDNLHLLGRSMIRWTYYQLNLFGDPSVSFHVSYPPEKPTRPDGPVSGNPGETQVYSSSSTDPNEDQIYYLFSWGDGTDTGWLGPYDSGQVVEANHVWDKKGNYEVKVKAKDTYGVEGPWSDPLSVNMPRYRIKYLYRIVELLKNRFQILDILL
jgi:hypothetical protein